MAKMNSMYGGANLEMALANDVYAGIKINPVSSSYAEAKKKGSIRFILMMDTNKMKKGGKKQ
jgi:hypothetical protein